MSPSGTRSASSDWNVKVDSHFRHVVEHVAAAEPEVQAGAVDVFVAVLQDDDRLVVDAADAARVDVAADAVVPPDPEIHAPAVEVSRNGGSGCARPSRPPLASPRSSRQRKVSTASVEAPCVNGVYVLWALSQGASQPTPARRRANPAGNGYDPGFAVSGPRPAVARVGGDGRRKTTSPPALFPARLPKNLF